MSYRYPSQEEAESQYEYNRRQYYNAGAESKRLQREKDWCMGEKRNLSNGIDSLNREKLNFEKRLSGIDRIIAKLEGRTPFFSSANNVPAAIELAAIRMNEYEESYGKSIKVSGIPKADVRRAFRIQTVEENPRSHEALRIYTQKRRELAESIENIKKSIQQMEGRMDDLQNRMRQLTDMQLDLSRLMRNSVYNMEHFRRFL